MVDLHSRVLSKASFPFSLRTSSDIDFCTKKSSLFTIKRFFYTYCALKVKDFHFFYETSSYFVYAKIYKSGKNFCGVYQRHDARGNPTVDYPPIQGVAAVILQSTSYHRNRRLKLRPGVGLLVLCALFFFKLCRQLLKNEKGGSLSSLEHLVELNGLGLIEYIEQTY